MPYLPNTCFLGHSRYTENLVAERCWSLCLPCSLFTERVELVGESLDERSSTVDVRTSVEHVGGRDALLRVEDSLRLSLCVSGGQRQLNCGKSLNSRLWRAIQLGPNGRRSTSDATAGECVDGSECDT